MIINLFVNKRLLIINEFLQHSRLSVNKYLISKLVPHITDPPNAISVKPVHHRLRNGRRFPRQLAYANLTTVSTEKLLNSYRCLMQKCPRSSTNKDRSRIVSQGPRSLTSIAKKSTRLGADIYVCI